MPNSTTHRTTAADYRARRKLLLAGSDQPLAVHSGTPMSRNYPALHYPFRASSDFLYLAGWNHPGVSVVLEGDRCTLYFDAPSVEDAVWEGAGPDLGQLMQRYGFDAVRPTSELPTVEFLDPTALLEQRLHQDAAGRAQLQLACDITVRAHRNAMRVTRPGGTEHAVLAALLDSVTREGVVPSFGPIVSVHGEVLHNPYHENVLRDGDLLLVDFGAESPEGWAGDVTRTFPVSGKFSARQKEIYELVLAANVAAIADCTVGRRYRDVHLTAARTIAAGLVDLGLLKGDPDTLVERGAHALFFPHGVGHLLGLDCHDMEGLGDLAGYAPGRSRSPQFGLNCLRLDRDLEEGMAVTIEPGFYWIPQLLENPERTQPFTDCLNLQIANAYREVRGIRVEDDVIVSTTGPQVLTSALPKSVACLEAAVGR